MYVIIDPKTNVIIEKGLGITRVKRNEVTGLFLATSDNESHLSNGVMTSKGVYYNTDLYSNNYVKVIENIKFQDDIQIPDNMKTISTVCTKEDDIIVNYTKYHYSTEDDYGENFFYNDIEQIQKDKQEENKQLFNEYLLAHPYEYNGKQYGTTLQDQLEINLMLSQAQAMAEPQVEWHATTEVNESMSVSDLLAIQAGIKNAVAAPYKKMQEYKKAIFDCTDAKTLVEMSFEYEGDKNA